jgi:hypothetical protein
MAQGLKLAILDAAALSGRADTFLRDRVTPQW